MVLSRNVRAMRRSSKKAVCRWGRGEHPRALAVGLGQKAVGQACHDPKAREGVGHHAVTVRDSARYAVDSLDFTST